MAIQSYNSEITRTASTADVALERLRNLEIVNRYTGATLTDASNTVLGTTDNFVTLEALNSAGQNLEQWIQAGVSGSSSPYTYANTEANFVVDAGQSNRLVTATIGSTGIGVYAVIGKTIVIDGTFSILAAAAGVHLQFFNCSIIYRPGGSNGSSTPPVGTQQDLNSDAIDSRVSQSAASTRSVSFYGCSFSVAPTAAANVFMQFGDVMNSTIQFGGGVHTPLPCFSVGSRAVNATFLCENVGNTAVLEIYGAPDISEGLVIRNHSIEITGTGASTTETYQQLYTNPDFTGPGNLQRWRTQGSATAQSAFQVIGPFNPFNNVLVDTVRTPSGDNGVQTFAHLRDGIGQVLNYYGWTPGFFSDASQTLPIQNVAARLRTSAEMANSTRNSTGGQTSMLTAIGNTPSGYGDQTGDTKSDATVFRSNANGVLVADAATRYSSNAVASNPSYTGGWWDMLRFRPYNTTGATIGGNTLGQTWFDAPAPDNTIFGPIAQVTGTAYGQYETDVDYRSYSHDIAYTEAQNGVIGTADGNQGASTLAPIDESNFIGGSLVGVRVKSTNVDAATNLPDFSHFAADEPVSLNDLGNVVRAGWHLFSKDPEAVNFPDTNGIFDERQQPIRVHVYADGTQITGTNAGVWRVSNASVGEGQWSVRVLGNGIAAKDDDLYAELPGVTTFNFHGQTVAGSTLNVAERLNHIGNVSDVVFSSGNILDSGSSTSLYDIIFSPNDVDAGHADEYDGTGITITGTCSFNAGVVHPTGQPFNPPILVGYDATGTAVESDITFTKGTLSTIDESVPGMWDNSKWNGVSTGSGLTAPVFLNLEVNGGSHAMNFDAYHTDDVTFRVRNIDAISINLPEDSSNNATTPTASLLTIDTGATASDTAQRDLVRAWLVSELGETAGVIPGVSEVRADQTAPSTGIWLIGPPEADPIPYQWILNDVGVLDSGYWIIKNTDNDTIYNQTTITNGVVTTPPTQVFNTTNTNYRSYLMLTSSIGGAVYKCSIQDFTSANVENANFTADLQVRPDLVNAFFTQASSQLQAGDGGNDIVAEVLAHTPGTDKLVLQWTNADGVRATETGTQAGVIQAFTTVQGTQRYVTYLAEFNRLFDLIDYQPSAMAINNSAEGVDGVSQTEGVFFNSVSQSTQQKGTSASGFNSDPTVFTVPSGAGAGDTFPSATNNQFQSNTSSTLSVPNTVNAISSTLAGSGSATASDLTELGNEIKANQGKLSTDVRLASQLRPASGTIPNTAD